MPPSAPSPPGSPGASGASYVRSFDLDGRIAKITSSTGNALTYDYDNGGRIKSIGESGRFTQVFGYDRANRLTKYARGSTSILYDYDASGNRIAAGGAAYEVSPVSNRLVSLVASGSSEPQTFSYSPAGVLVIQSGVFTLGYDTRNRLVRSTVGALTASYGVNDLGERVTKTRTTSAAREYFVYLYDLSGHLVGTYDASGAAREEIVWLGDLPVATLQGGAAYYIMPDHLGAPHEIVNAANARVWLWDHDPFGNGAPVAAAGFSHDLRFPGQIYDSETRLHNNGFRDYSPALGRYVESDPIGLEGGINTYAYAKTLSAVDPTGTILPTPDLAWDAFNLGLGISSFLDNFFNGNYFAAGSMG
ncbi:RHS repeat-associated core domain-containing protein [Methylosinus sp. Sm6]|uniref:RHS repeat-associated core domain-containing protein n=1 Tax=Methylosinus sp. Sm6 TaxID=2866948 RepID=UPI0021042CC7|nr:RHS repeat-associated core domain-containing protein [Methylosinus sp. Sm6]